MNRYLLFITLILSVGRVFGQTDQEIVIQNALQARTITEIENAKGKYKFVKEHWDLLNSGLVQSNFKLSKKKKFQRIGLLTLSFNSEIIYSEVYSWDFNDEFTNWEHKTLKSWTNEDFKLVSIVPEHLVRLPYRSTFGYACGAGAGMPDEGQQMMNFIDEENTIKLTDWLKSINPVRQAFAYLGFSLLEAHGIMLDMETKKMMNELESSDFHIYYCSGCTVWETAPFSELLTDEQVQQFIDRNMK